MESRLSVQEFIKLRDKIAQKFETPIATWSIKEFLEATANCEKRLRLAVMIRAWQLQQEAGGLSGRQAASYFNTSTTTFSNWTRGDTFPTRESLKIIAQVFGLSLRNLEIMLGDIPPEKEVKQDNYNDAIRAFLNLPKEAFVEAFPLAVDRLLAYASDGTATPRQIASALNIPELIPQTLSELLVGKDLGAIADASLLPLTRIEAIAQGQLVRPSEIEQLAEALKVEVSKLSELAKNQNRVASELSEEESAKSLINSRASIGHNAHSQRLGFKTMRGSIGHLIQEIFRQERLSVEEDFDQLAALSTTQDPARLQRFKLIALSQIDPEFSELMMISVALSRFTNDYQSYTQERLLDIMEHGHHPQNENAPNHSG